MDVTYRFVGDRNFDCGTLNKPHRSLIFFTDVRQTHTYHSTMSDLAEIDLIADYRGLKSPALSLFDNR